MCEPQADDTQSNSTVFTLYMLKFASVHDSYHYTDNRHKTEAQLRKRSLIHFQTLPLLNKRLQLVII